MIPSESSTTQQVRKALLDDVVPENLVRLLEQHLQGLHFGEVVLKIHEGEVVQIERLSRSRPRRNRVPGGEDNPPIGSGSVDTTLRTPR